MAVLIAGSYALSERRHLFPIAIALSALSIIATWVLLIFPRHWAVLLSHASVLVLVAFFCVTILGHVLRSGRITADKIFAAICVYLLVGYAWTFVYALIDELQRGSFTGLAETSRNDFTARIMQLRYFSFMTLTTVGYGDVVPRSPIAQTMAVLEAVMGHIVHGSGLQSREKG